MEQVLGRGVRRDARVNELRDKMLEERAESLPKDKVRTGADVRIDVSLCNLIIVLTFNHIGTHWTCGHPPQNAMGKGLIVRKTCSSHQSCSIVLYSIVRVHVHLVYHYSAIAIAQDSWQFSSLL